MATGAMQILLVEDQAAQRTALGGFLRKAGHTVLEAGSADQARAAAKSAAAPVELLITDLKLGGPDGVSLMEALRPDHLDMEALVVTAFGTTDDAVRAMRAGAYDFISKPIDLTRLEVLLEKIGERVRLKRENRKLRDEVRGDPFGEIIGQAEALQRIMELAARVAPSRVPVLVLGESGTGKEVLARAIHRASPRAGRPFVAVNCAVFTETLVESELFGHEKGAFTGAATEKKGRFELAEGGTLFLDEVGDIPLLVQVKLLQVLQNQTFERVGGTRTLHADVRVVAATHRDLAELIAAGRFRADLFYRLNVVSFTLPALRERPGDIPLLVEHFLKKHADLATSPVRGVDPAVLDRLQHWPFPGNIRELENWLERAVVLAEGPLLTATDFPPQLFEDARTQAPTTNPPGPEAQPAQAEGLEEQVARLEKTLISQALARNGGNKSAAARDLGITERTVRYKLRKLGL